MELKIINEPIKQENWYTYELILKYMHGDADAYTTETIMIAPEHEQELKDFLTFLELYFAFPRNDRRECWEKLPGFEHWLEDEQSEERWEAAQISLEPDRDVTSDHQFTALLVSYELFFYDRDSKKFRMEVIKDA